MLFEDLLWLAALASGVFFIGIPVYQFLRMSLPQRKNPVAEAKLRLAAAKAEAEAARLNKETEKLYEDIYHDLLEDDTTNNENDRRRI